MTSTPPTLPHDVLAEQVLLGQAAQSLRVFERAVGNGVRADHFFDPKHNEIWTAITNVVRRDHQVDPLAVAAELRQSAHWDADEANKTLNAFSQGALLHQLSEALTERVVLDMAGKRDTIAYATNLLNQASNGVSTLDLLKNTEAWIQSQERRTPLKYEDKGPRPLSGYGAFAPLSWIVGVEEASKGGLIPGGYPTTLVADGGTGKSFLALHLAMTVAATGSDWLGFKVSGGKVLYLDFELDARVTVARAARVANGLWAKPGLPENLHYIACREEGLKLSDAFRRLEGWIRDHDYKLVVVDSLSIAMSDDPSDPTKVIDLLNRRLNHVSKTDCGVLLLDHRPKAQAGTDSDQRGAFGSVFKRNIARSVILGSSEKNLDGSVSVRMVHNKSNFGETLNPFGARLTWSEHSVVITQEEVSGSVTKPRDENGLSESGHVIVRYLGASGLTASNSEIALATGLPKGSIATMLVRLAELGFVERVGRGQWKATDAGRATVGQPQEEETPEPPKNGPLSDVDRLLQSAFEDYTANEEDEGGARA